MSAWSIIFRLLFLLCCASDVRPLTCLHCTNSPKPRLCKTVTECDVGQVCVTEKTRNDFGEDVYNVGCLATSECSGSGSGCLECCNSSLCNARGCGQDGYPPIHDRICYNCPVYTDSNPCHAIDFCANGEVCMFETKRIFGDLVYSSRCAESNFCKQHIFGDVTLVGRESKERSRDLHIRESPSQVPCYGCCSEDLCNRQCNATNTLPPTSVISFCQPNPCQHGQCADGFGDFVCHCDPGFMGKRCDKAVPTNYCLPSSCAHGTCYNITNGFICKCDHGYEGKLCNISLDICDPSPCVHGRCFHQNSSYSCICDQWFEGTNCDQAIGRCRSNPCQHGQCYDITDDYVCLCDHGYEGKQCDVSVHANYCSPNPCINGRCFSEPNDFICICSHGYEGKLCNTSKYACDSNPCLHGRCAITNAGYTCNCDQWFEGTNCDIPISHCRPSPCVHGTCHDIVDDFACICEHRFEGKRCDIYSFGCDSSPCLTGQCINEKNGYSCKCDNGISGKTCDQRLSDCYEILHKNLSVGSGVYKVRLWQSHRDIDVYCDMDTDGGGWTVFQSRFNGSVDFNRSFSDYEHGFGSLYGEFWLGLTYIQEMAAQSRTDLRLDLTTANGSTAFEVFHNFRLESNGYTLNIDKGSGTAGDSESTGLSYHNGHAFATYDRPDSYGCADRFTGWWLANCLNVHLNGQYFTPGTDHSFYGIFYNTYQQLHVLKATQMKFRSVV